MKKLLFASALLTMAAGAFTSCTQDVGPETVRETTQTGHVRLSCTLPAVSITPMAARATRAELTANGTALTDIYILDYDKQTGELLQILHQTSTASDFAEPELTLAYGTHTLRVIATRSAAPTLLTAASDEWTPTANVLTAISGAIPETLTTTKTSDTFAAETDVTVAAGSEQVASITLDRIVAKMLLNVTDTFPADCYTLDAAFNEYRSIQIADLSVIGCVKNHRITDVSAAAGQTGHTVIYYLLVPSEGYTTDITITPTRLNGDDYQSVTINDVPFERNKITTITGSFYDHSKGLSIQVNDTWADNGHDINI